MYAPNKRVQFDFREVQDDHDLFLNLFDTIAADLRRLLTRLLTRPLPLESEPWALSLLDFVKKQGEWTGTATELLNAVDQTVAVETRSSSRWPKDPRAVSARLNRVGDALRAQGISIERRSRSKRITLKTNQETQI